MIVGGREAAKAADRLKAEHVAVILRLSFPEEPKVPTEEEYRKRPLLEQEEPLKLLADRRDKWKEQVATAAALARAGIPFAFATEGLERLDSFPAKLRALIANGLTADQALAALTTHAATIAGLEHKLGTLEPGKLGHLVAFSAPFQDEQAKARFVLIDGLKFEVKAPEPGPEKAGPFTARGGPRGESRPSAQARPAILRTGHDRIPRHVLTRRGKLRRRPETARMPPRPSGHPIARRETGEPPSAQGRSGARGGQAHGHSASRDKVKGAQPPAEAQPKTALPPASAKQGRAEGGRGPAPGSRPASPEEKAPPQPLVDVATELDADRKPKIKTGGNVLIKDATILTVTKGTIPRARSWSRTARSRPWART